MFRRILAAGAPLDQVEIACATDEHVAIVWEKALRHEWPVTLGPGVPATATRPGRALIGLCDWIETDYSAGHLRRLLQSGDMGLEEDDEGFTAGQAARTIARSEAGWGRDTYSLSLAALRANYEARAKDADLAEEERTAAAGKAGQASLVLAWVEKLIAALPAPGADGLVPVQQVVDATLAYLDRSTARISALDHRAAAALAEYLAELRALGPFSCPLPLALRFVRERVQSLQVAPDRPRPGHLYACRLAQTGYSGRPHLFVVGLEEGRVFPSATEDAVLLDAERTAISPELRLSTDKIDEAVYSVLARLAAWGGAEPRAPSAEPRAPASITFSYSCRDTREFRETYASWLMLQAYRLQRGDDTLSYPQMKASLGEPKSLVPADRAAARSRGSWWLRSILGSDGAGVRLLEANFPALAHGRVAEEQRESDGLTEYDGHVPEAGRVLDPCADGHVMSVTELERAATCPFRFFLSRGLGLRPVDGRERDRDVWLDPMTRGNELHDFYAALLRRCRDEKRGPDLVKDGRWLQARGKERLAELHREMPAATEEIRERESRDFLADLQLFVEAECEMSGRTALGFEVSFGRPLNGDDEPLARAEPLEIDLGHGLTLRIAGRIDRIDRVGPGRFEVIDYKTGVYWPPKFAGTFRRGRLLQHAIYGLAALELLKARYSDPKVVAGVYYFSSQTGRRNRVRKESPAAKSLAAVLADLRKVIVDGAFVHAKDEDEDCRYCDYEVVCAPGVHEQTAAKAADPKLEAFRRLGQHA